jgi:arabinofuranosyltransferase
LPRPHSTNEALLTGVAVLVATWTVFRFSWLTDDALISARVVANAVNGAGPVANLDERVQSFTHPLWVLIWTIASAVSGEIVLVPVYLGLALTLGLLVLLGLSATVPWFGVAALVSLTLSTAFVTWSTSGLENPLAGALLGLAWLLTRGSPDHRRLLASAVVLGLVCVTRLDLAVVVAPLAAWLLLRRTTWARRASLAAAFLAAPVAYLWWSAAFYGYALPATYYAKTNTAIPRADLVGQGLSYVGLWVERDPGGALLVLVGLLWLLWRPDPRRLAWAGGLVLYVLYVVSIGGDFMMGRFFYVLVVIAAFSVAEPPRGLSERPTATWPWVAVSGVLLVANAGSVPLAQDESEGQQWSWLDTSGVADERGFYVERRLSVFGHAMNRPTGAAIDELRDQSAPWNPDESARKGGREVVVLCGLAGSVGMSVGPDVHLLDTCALSDMYLAQIPYRPTGPWRIGHFERPLPDGYVESIERGENLVVDPDLAAELDHVWGLIRPPAAPPMR